MSEKSKLVFPQSASQMLESKLIERRAYFEAANQSAASHWQRQQSELTQAENSIREMDNALKSAVQSLQQRQQSTMVQVENSMRKMDNALKSAAQSLQQCQQSATAQAENSMCEVNNALKSAAQSMNDAISSPFEKLNQQLRDTLNKSRFRSERH